MCASTRPAAHLESPDVRMKKLKPDAAPSCRSLLKLGAGWELVGTCCDTPGRAAQMWAFNILWAGQVAIA